ncbi:M48 family metalloprotease [Dyella sp. C9]|uniref:M48 family metalloprotease n=1 Tax=Dyella sp. C9 TaxID=2202154 RepID=UPI0018E56733|nr:M48 family metalloprotease [Dyella sp. C9]
MRWWRVGWVGMGLLSLAAIAHAQVPIPAIPAREVQVNRLLDAYWLAGRIVQLLLPLVLLCSGYGARLCRGLSAWVRGSRFLTEGLFGSAYVLLGALVSLPIDYGRHYLLPKSLGWLGDETRGQWLAGQLLGLLPWLVAAMLLLWVPYALMRRSPRRWWLWATLAVIPVTVFFLIVQPLWIKPLSAQYEPLADGSLRASIDALAARCGLVHVPVVVGGNDTAVYGLGPTARIFLQQDLASTETPGQIRFTVAHELKHYVLADNWKLLPIIALLALAGFWLTYRIGGHATRRLHRRFGFARMDDPASLPLLVLCMTVLWLAVTPAFLAYNRYIEREADRFGLELSHENEAAARLFASWAGEGTDWVQPDRFALAFFYTHPSIAERMRMANDYHPWLEGKPLRYAGSCER